MTSSVCGKGCGTLKKWKENWPFLGAVLLIVASVDWIVIPLILESLKLYFWITFCIVVLLANMEIVGWFYFWRWFAWEWLPKREKIEEAVEFVKSVIELLREHGLLKTITIKALWTFRWATNMDRIPSLKKWGHFWMLFLGAEPFFTGGRLLGVISCSAMRWKAGLISLCIGNIAHVYISIKAWKLTFYLWDNYKGLFTVLMVIVVLFFAGRSIWKKLKGVEVT